MTPGSEGAFARFDNMDAVAMLATRSTLPQGNADARQIIAERPNDSQGIYTRHAQPTLLLVFWGICGA